jgi:hypothetical protein
MGWGFLLGVNNMATFTSTAEIIRLIGKDAYEDLMEGLLTSQRTTFMEEVVAYATGVITSYTQEYYLDDSIANVPEIRMRARVIAANFLSQRRGNAPLYETELERIYEYLNDIKDYRRHISGQAVIEPDIPAVRNHVVNQNTRDRMQLDERSSTGSYPGQVTAPTDSQWLL